MRGGLGQSWWMGCPGVQKDVENPWFSPWGNDLHMVAALFRSPHLDRWPVEVFFYVCGHVQMIRLKPCTSLETRNTICISVIWGGGKGGVGWGNNVHFKWHTHGMYVVQSGWGLVGWGKAKTFMPTWTRMDWDILLHFHTHVMLRSGIVFCTCTQTHTRHATLWDLPLHFHTHVMLRSGIFSCTCTHTSCYALGSSLALAHTRHATLWDLPLHLHTHVMLRSGIFSCTCTHTSCYALGSSLALAHTRHATLWDLLLHMHTHVMLRSGIFSCTCTHTSCYALGSSLALAHTRHATLWDLLLHLHTHVMLRSEIFFCTCNTWNFLSRCRNLMCQIIHETQWKTCFLSSQS